MDGSGLDGLGWDPQFMVPAAADSSTELGRVVRVDGGSCLVATAAGESRARGGLGETVGDWVSVRTADGPRVVEVLARRSEIARRDPNGLTQTLAANVDLVLVAAPADRLSLPRVEREVVIAWDGGAEPVVLLTKADLDDGSAAAQVRDRVLGVEVVAVSAATGVGEQAVRDLLTPNRTAVLLGPSGAGKSTLVNLLLGWEAAATGQVRDGDRRGRHVTTARELHQVPTGGVLIDTPGLRSLGLAADHGGVAATFPEIEELAGECRFGDCTHEHEPGCAVLGGVETGEVSPERLASYRKLRQDLLYQARRDDPAAARESRAALKARSKAARRFFQERGH